MTFTYMAKYSRDFPGNNLNLKLTLLDSNDKPVSEEINDNFIAGIIKYAKDFSTMYLPNVNSYKRLYEDDIKDKWHLVGNNSNIKGINKIKENDINKIGFALPGSDANPYLVLFALIESGKLGLNENLKSEEVSNIITKENNSFPTSLYKANKIFKNSKIAKEVLGDSFHDHFSAFYHFEYQNFNNQVSEWELERYLYSI